MKNQCSYAASHLGRPWTCIDAVDDADAITAVSSIACSVGPERAYAIVELSTKLAAGATGGRKWADAIKKGGGGRIRTDRGQFDALARTAENADIRWVGPALRGLIERPNVRVHRRQLYRDVLAALAVLEREGGTGEDAVWAARNRTRHRGRAIGQAAIGRTVLVKGLEFDHVIVLDTEKMNARNLYVALTRGSRKVTVISVSRTLTPRGR